MKDLLKYKIENAEDVEKITDVPILGELPLSKKPDPTTVLNALVKENVYPDPRIGLNNYLMEVCPLSRGVMSQPLSPPLQLSLIHI